MRRSCQQKEETQREGNPDEFQREGSMGVLPGHPAARDLPPGKKLESPTRVLLH